MFHVGVDKSSCTRNTTNLTRPHPSAGKNRQNPWNPPCSRGDYRGWQDKLTFSPLCFCCAAVAARRLAIKPRLHKSEVRFCIEHLSATTTLWCGNVCVWLCFSSFLWVSHLFFSVVVFFCFPLVTLGWINMNLSFLVSCPAGNCCAIQHQQLFQPQIPSWRWHAASWSSSSVGGNAKFCFGCKRRRGGGHAGAHFDFSSFCYFVFF